MPKLLCNMRHIDYPFDQPLHLVSGEKSTVCYIYPAIFLQMLSLVKRGMHYYAIAVSS